MEAHELRIGNYINNGFNDVIRISEYSMISKHLTAGYITDTLKPIPLTEEWLLKFGFEKCWYKMTFGKFVLNASSKKVLTGELCSFFYENIYVEYVHQLQNLYFALTGEELITVNCKL